MTTFIAVDDFLFAVISLSLSNFLFVHRSILVRLRAVHNLCWYMQCTWLCVTAVCDVDNLWQYMQYTLKRDLPNLCWYIRYFVHDLTDVWYYDNDWYFCFEKYISSVRTLGQVPQVSHPLVESREFFLLLKILWPGKSWKNVLESDAFIHWFKCKTSSNSIALSSCELWIANVHIFLLCWIVCNWLHWEYCN